MIYELVKGNNPHLRKETGNYDFEAPPLDERGRPFMPEALAESLKESMIYHKGIGLSACQIGFPWNVFAVGDPNDPDNIVVMFNPHIVDTSPDSVLMEEGCLSYPGLFVKVKRPSTIRLRYIDSGGTVVTEVYNGVPARVILHEYDHSKGITFQKRASTVHLEQAKKQKIKLDKKRKSNYNKAKAK